MQTVSYPGTIFEPDDEGLENAHDLGRLHQGANECPRCGADRPGHHCPPDGCPMEREPTTAEKRAWLKRRGFVVGERDPRLNTDYPGAFMVAEAFEPDEVPTRDGSNGPWCIVGDDLDSLISEAFEAHN